MAVVQESRVAWNLLRGIMCVYKPAGVTEKQLKWSLAHNLCKDLCELKPNLPTNYVSIEGSINESLTVKVAESYVSHPLVMGPGYEPRDIHFRSGIVHEKDTSGVLPLGINDRSKAIMKLHYTFPTRTYHITGKFGEATDTYFTDGAVVEKAKFDHVKQSTLDRILAAFQASHQKQMFELCGLDIQSQAAYELACQGPIRPSSTEAPIIYSIKCVNFELPHFTVEIVCVNEYEMFLKELIHEIGMKLHTVSTCTALRCTRYGHFTLEHALLRKYWHLEYVINNIQMCNELVNKHEATRQMSARLISPVEMKSGT